MILRPQTEFGLKCGNLAPFCFCRAVLRRCVNVDRCGTAVVGDGSGDGRVRKDVFTHPHSMYKLSYQWQAVKDEVK